MTAAVKPATARQMAFLTSLATEHLVPAAAEKAIREGSVDGRKCSEIIASLLRMRKSARTVENGPEGPGMYLHDGTVFKVQRSEAGRLYAKRLDVARGECEGHEMTEGPIGAEFYCDGSCRPGKPRFEYDPGAIHRLTESERMTLDQAKAFGVETGVCCVCGTELTDPKSIAAGIGPVCAKRV